MQLDPDVEAAQAETERKEIDLTDEKVVKPIVDLVMAGVITPEYAREVLGIPQEKNRPAPDAIAARLGARGDVPDGLCDECEYFDAEENWCSIREIETRFDNNACRYFEATEETVTTPAADATGKPKPAEECVGCC